MGVDVIDFTDLQKRGFIATEKVEQSPDTIDFTLSNAEDGAGLANSVTPVVSEQSNPFDMLSSLAQVGESTSNLPIMSSSSEQLPSASSDLGLKLDTIVNKLEDTMYKIETISSRLTMIESKLESRKSPFS